MKFYKIVKGNQMPYLIKVQGIFSQRKQVCQQHQIVYNLLLSYFIINKTQEMMIDKILKEPSLKEIDIIVKCKKYPEFRKQLIEIEQNYALDLKMSPHSKMKKTKELIPFDIVNRNKLFVNFYGYRMNFKEEEFRDLYLYWIQKMEEYFKAAPTRRYTIVYYHSMSSSIAPYVFIKDSFKKLPIQYYALLDKIYIVQSSFFLRNASIFQFGRLHKLYSRRLEQVQNIKQLGQIDQIKKNQILDGIPEVLSLQQSLGNDKKGKKQEKGNKKSQIFTKPAVVLKKDCLMVQLSSHKIGDNNIPIFLSILVTTIRKYPQIMHLQGIFRKSGSIEQEQEIIEELSSMEKVDVLPGFVANKYSGFAVAGVIKKFFTKLERPIVPYAVYNWIMSLNGIQENQQVQIVREIIAALPPLNKSIILFIIRFISNQVLQFKEDNKMNYYNMSVVFSPCFFRPQTETFQDLLNSGRFASILKILFTKFEEIVGKQQAQSPLKKNQNQNRGSKGSRGSKQSRGSKGTNQSSLKPLNTNI